MAIIPNPHHGTAPAWQSRAITLYIVIHFHIHLFTSNSAHKLRNVTLLNDVQPISLSTQKLFLSHIGYEIKIAMVPYEVKTVSNLNSAEFPVLFSLSLMRYRVF